jgi:hypothetical protein
MAAEGVGGPSFQHGGRRVRFGHFLICSFLSNLFRISCFGFRISAYRAAVWFNPPLRGSGRQTNRITNNPVFSAQVIAKKNRRKHFEFLLDR